RPTRRVRGAPVARIDAAVPGRPPRTCTADPRLASSGYLRVRKHLRRDRHRRHGPGRERDRRAGNGPSRRRKGDHMSDTVFALYPVFLAADAFRELEEEDVGGFAQEVENLAKSWEGVVDVRGSYSTVGFRSDADLMLWLVGRSAED